MSTKIKILLAALLLIAVFSREKIFDYLGLNKAAVESRPVKVSQQAVSDTKEVIEQNEAFIEDTLYYWDKQYYDWVPVVLTQEEYEQQINNPYTISRTEKEPININWEELTDVFYHLRYFSDLDMEILAPIFSQSVKALDGKEVIIEGYVIPFDEEEKLLSLSANPYAACFFCGRASPTSIISMYLKNERKRYKMDDFIKFKGKLELNYDNPNEFYYILRNAEEE
jgi:hypothetical protein